MRDLRIRIVLRELLRDESGQAMAEYASITTLFWVGTLAAGLISPFSSALFAALQNYVDFYFYALNLAVG